MRRRRFLSQCALLGGAATLPQLAGLPAAWAQAAPRLYARTRLADVHGRPIRAADLAPETNYVFHYPFAATPCLLLKLARPVAVPATAKRNEVAAPAWQGGVGRDRNVVAFSAICAHKLMYPTPAISFIGLRKGGRGESAQVIHCCGDHSRYDPLRGARVIGGPAPQPLAAVLLEWDAASDRLHAVGTRGGEMFDAFFEKYAMKLELETGSSLRKLSGPTVIVQPAARYSRQWRSCSV